MAKVLNRIIFDAAMIPRGEVTLIFAGIGESLGIINDVAFSALIIMVIITTLITPPALRMAMSEKPLKQKD